MAYFQCPQAREFLVKEIQRCPSLPTVAAFEASFTDTDIPDWGGQVYKLLVDESTVAGAPPYICSCGYDQPQIRCSCGRTLTAAGTHLWRVLCTEAEIEASLGKLSSKTMREVFQMAITTLG